MATATVSSPCSASNAVTLPGYTRVDGAVYYEFNDRKSRVALNVENLFDKRYFSTADNDNNLRQELTKAQPLAGDVHRLEYRAVAPTAFQKLEHETRALHRQSIPVELTGTP